MIEKKVCGQLYSQTAQYPFPKFASSSCKLLRALIMLSDELKQIWKEFLPKQFVNVSNYNFLWCVVINYKSAITCIIL